MDFELDADQLAIREAVEALLDQHAGVERAVALAADDAYDTALAKELAATGFLEVALGEETGALEAALVVEAVARAAGVVSVGAEALVAPAVVGSAVPGPVALVDAAEPGPVRFAAGARTLLVLRGDGAERVTVEPGTVGPVRSWYGYPMGHVDAAVLAHGESLGADSGARLRAWWRVALAVECAGTMAAAVDATVAYVKERRQFGRAIGSFQAVQHRLAECHVLVQGARLLAFEAAHRGAPEEAAAIAASHAVHAAQRVFGETHQLSGAIGYTREHPLHAFTMRLQALRLELGGAGAHRGAAARARWSGA